MRAREGSNPSMAGQVGGFRETIGWSTVRSCSFKLQLQAIDPDSTHARQASHLISPPVFWPYTWTEDSISNRSMATGVFVFVFCCAAMIAQTYRVDFCHLLGGNVCVMQIAWCNTPAENNAP